MIINKLERVFNYVLTRFLKHNVQLDTNFTGIWMPKVLTKPKIRKWKQTTTI